LHCKCLRLTVSVASTYPLVCPHCVNGMCLQIKSLSDDVVQLHSVVTEQSQTIDSLWASMSGISEGKGSFDADIARCTPGTGSNDSSERKYNIVVFGASECARGSAQPDRYSHDLNIITELFQGLSSSFDPQSVRDLHRLGKYQSDSDRRRPILPDLSAHESTVRSVLLKEKCSLIKSGTEKRDVRLRSDSLYIGSRLCGRVIDGQFVKHPTLASAAPVLDNINSPIIPVSPPVSGSDSDPHENDPSVPSSSPDSPGDANSTRSDPPQLPEDAAHSSPSL
uniref:Uncharacterized protein n=1 Tax=Amphimedon queenslandica TaxID=400682 RepID=A0A1X7VHC0_AMPQE